MSRRPRKITKKRRSKERPKRPVRLYLVLGAVCVVVAFLIFRAFDSSAPPTPKNVILISVDTLRADHLGCYGYEAIRTPHIDRLAAESVLFENVATVTPLTLPAHASIFTGRGPLEHGVIDNFGYLLGEREETLAELLHEHGFATGGFIGSFVLDSRWGVSQGFTTYFDRFEAPGAAVTTMQANQRSGDEVLDPALDWIRDHSSGPFFAFIHFYDPHTPYSPPEPYRSEYGSDRIGRYDGEVAFVDSLVGRLIAVLEEQGLYQDTMIVFMSDHGESLGEHGEDGHGLFLYDATIRVPLLIKGPRLETAGRVAAQVRTIDVMPTVLDVVGLDVPSSVEGESLRPLLHDVHSESDLSAFIESHYARLHFGWAPLRGMRDSRYKFVEAPIGELYDLMEDPDETRNLYDEQPEIVRRYKEQIEAFDREYPSLARSSEVIDVETERRLQALGYVTSPSAAPSSPEDWKTLADPKEKIGVFNSVTEATTLNLMGDFEGAVALLTSVLEEDPDVMLAYTILGNLYLQRGAYREAVEVFDSALDRDERNFNASYGLALAHKGLGRLDRAESGFRQCLEIEPGRIRAVYQLAEVQMAVGRTQDAERLLRQHLESRPDTSLYLTLADALLAQNKRQDAFRILEEAATRDPDDASVQLSLGNLLMEDGNVEAALGAFQKAEGAAPRDTRVQNALGNAFARMGRDQDAQAAFQRAVEYDPSFAPAHNNLGIALARQGSYAEAEKAFQRAIEQDSDYAEAYNNLGFLYLQAGAGEKAVPLFRRAVALRPDYPQAKANLEAALQATRHPDS